MLGVRFREARAGDAPACAPLVHASASESLNYVLANAPGGAVPFLVHALARPGGEFGYAIHVVGELDGRIVACGGGWRHGGARLALATGWSALAYLGPIALPAVCRRYRQAASVMPGPIEGEYYVGNLGVDAGMRRRGIGQALIEMLLEPARIAGCRRAVLDVSAENPRAEALYARLGFVVAVTRDSAFADAHGRVPAQRRMEKELST